jgi:hypothetical protein
VFSPITVPYGAKMLFNTLTLKPGVSFDDVELAVGEVCNFVKETYGGEKGFLGGQIFKYAGAMADEDFAGSRDPRIAIVTYWRSFEDHERSHGDAAFRAKFDALTAMCSEQEEAGYDMMWQGMPEG